MIRSLLKSVWFVAILAIVRPLRDLVRTVRRRHPVRIFTFHRVSENRKDGMTVSQEGFRARIAYLLRFHDLVTLPNALQVLRSGARLRRPIAVVTFDDGYLSVAARAAPIMSQAGITGTCFINTDYAGTRRRLDHDTTVEQTDCTELMSWDDVARLQAGGWTVGSHTASHPRLANCSRERIDRELTDGLDALRHHLQETDVALAFPFGGCADISTEAITAARELGHTACLGNFGGENWPGTHTFFLRRIDIGGTQPIVAWKVALHGLGLRELARRFRHRGYWVESTELQELRVAAPHT